MKRLFLTVLFGVVLMMSASSARAAGWMFRGSYYTNSPSRGQEVGANRFARGIYYTAPRGMYFRSGYRNLHSHIYAGGYSSDHVNIRESWFQYGEQF